MDSTRYNVEVEVCPEYVEEHSDPEEGHFVFVYYIKITNKGAVTAQLRSRHWVITDADGQVQEIRGQGVVGKQPTILPQQQHSYHSFCVLKTQVGCMEGSFQMLAEDGTTFEAAIAPFSLAVPGVIN